MKKLIPFVVLMAFTHVIYAQSATPSIDHNNQTFSVNLGIAGSATVGADYYFEEADRIEKMGDFDGAISMFNKAAQEYQQNKMFGRYGTALIRLSNVHLSISNYAEAEKIVLKQALKNYSKIGSKSGQMLAYQQLGKVYLAANKLPESMWFYTQHGILAQQLQDKNAYIESVIGIASVKIKKKDYLLASKDLNTAELLSKNANIVQYNTLIKSNRAKISERTIAKKG